MQSCFVHTHMHVHTHTHAHILYIYTYSHTRTYARTRMHTHHHHRNNLGKSVCIIELHVFHTMSGTQTMGIGPIVITPSRNNGRQLICLFQYQFTDRQCILTSSNVRRTWQTEVQLAWNHRNAVSHVKGTRLMQASCTGYGYHTAPISYRVACSYPLLFPL